MIAFRMQNQAIPGTRKEWLPGTRGMYLVRGVTWYKRGLPGKGSYQIPGGGKSGDRVPRGNQ